TFPYWLVRRILDDPNAHYPRHSDQPPALCSIPRQLATNDDHATDHGFGRLLALFALGHLFRLRPLARVILAAVAGNAALLCGPDAAHQDVAHAQSRGLNKYLGWAGQARSSPWFSASRWQNERGRGKSRSGRVPPFKRRWH